ncbi:MAG: hypothetical protein M1821_006028 [Bathelium mastoideum]|nr:MAG: hypothetical protein M1821_006028 [Bathelium mastoideum]
MDSQYLPDTITTELVHELVSEYPEHVPDSLQRLEEVRMVSVPESLSKRTKNGKAYLSVNELAELMEWKLKHGTFRPKLLQLVKSNDEKHIVDTTSKSFERLASEATGLAGDIDGSLSYLVRLKGVGPATASLILSCYDQNNVPFFSDELYRWLHWERGTGKGWDRKLKYTIREYQSMYEKAQSCLQRLERESEKRVTSLSLEKAAYVLGKRAVNANLGKQGANAVNRFVEKSQSRKRKTSTIEEQSDVQSNPARRKTRSMKPKLTAER